MREKMKIGIFDSGIGGLTLLKEIRKLLPRENILYYCDFKNTPYSLKSQREILDLSMEIVAFLVRNHCKVIIAGCSLFSSASLDSLRKEFHIPIIGVIEPGVRASLLESEGGQIALIGNPFTVKKGTYTKAMESFSSKVNLTEIPCHDLCKYIEDGWIDSKKGEALLKTYLEMIPREADTLILGGTHYPLIMNEIKKYTNLPIVDSSRETVLELLDTLITTSLLNKTNRKGAVEFCATGDSSLLKFGIEKFLRRESGAPVYSL